jgi:hypothetical protein
MLRGDRALLDEALRLNPKDDVVRGAIAGLLLGFVDYATHHLVESKFIGDENDASAALAEAASILAAAHDPSLTQDLSQKREELTSLLSDWKEYQRSPDGTFPDWCRTRNRPYNWPSIVYYTE